MFTPPLLWLGLACLLLLLVLMGADSDGLLLIGGLAALLVTLGSALLPQVAVPVQLALFVVLATAGYGWLRLSSHKRGEKAIRPAAGAELAEVIEAFDSHGEGRVRWQGQSWAAQNMEPQHGLPAGSRVTVLGREGTRLQVLPQR